MALNPTFSRSPHLIDLIAEVERLATLIASADPAGAADLWQRAALATLRLDGSPITDVPDAEQIKLARASIGEIDVSGDRGTTWSDTIKLGNEPPPSDDWILWAREYHGVVSALSDDDLGPRLQRDPVTGLAELHRVLTEGLVAPEVAGRLRQTEQAVHDSSVGRIVYFASDPGAIPGELHALAGWLASAGAREHGLITSGVAHLELLRIHPFEAANGRLARAAARLLLRAHGLDPHGLAVAEIPLLADSIGTYDEVARTGRRKDMTIWLERWGEATSAGLRLAARQLGLLSPHVEGRARAFIDGATDSFTVIDYRADAGVEPPQARADLQALLDAGAITRRLGGRGLTFDLTTA